MNSLQRLLSLIKIETPRLILRPVSPGDEIEINQAINRSLDSLQRWMPWSTDPSLAATALFIKNAVDNWQGVNAFPLPLAVILKKSNTIIAASGFNERSIPSVPYYETGYWIDSQHEGKGYVTEYVTAITQYALTDLRASRVQIRTVADNKKSIAVALRCGYTQEGILRNENINSLTNKPVDSVIFSCCHVNDLNKLSIQASHKRR